MSRLNETLFEETIANYLGASPMYEARHPQNYDINRMVDAEMLLHFLRQQEAWEKLIKTYRDEREALDAVISEIGRQIIQRQVPVLTLLHQGITLQGRKLRLVQFKPDIKDTDSQWWKLYEQNRRS